jgi:hypothetical protein
MRLRLSACSRSYVPGIIAIGVAAFFGIPLAGATAEESSVTQPELKIALVIGTAPLHQSLTWRTRGFSSALLGQRLWAAIMLGRKLSLRFTRRITDYLRSLNTVVQL